MICCLNPDCHNPPNSDRTMFCFNCGTGLVVLRNRYRPIKSLGGGGFGKTYLAEDIDKLNEYCVIKQFAPQVQGTAALKKATELFEQEAKQLQQLGNHRQIPTLLAYFNQDNRLYLVQEFIDGQNLLDELKQQGIFNQQKVRELLLDLLDILKTVHQQQVIHRDIKPENIIRRSDGQLVLIDFGASKQLTATVMTQIGTTIGSFGYASLEQMQGGKAYPASDLYSIGATCFHLLSGIHPWELWQRQGYGWVVSWRQYLQQPVSEDLGRILDRLLQEEYQQRYQSAAEVLQALNSEPIPVTQPVTPPVTPPPLQKNSIPIYLVVIPLIVLMGGGAVYLLRPTNPVTIEQKSKSADTYYNEGLEKYNNKDFSGAIEDYTQAIEINPNYANAYMNRGLAHYDLGDNQAAIEDYNQAIKINPNYANAYINRGLARYDLGDKQTAIEDYNQAIEINPNDANAYYNRGLARYDLGDNQAAIEDYNQAIKINPNYANTYMARGLARYNLGDNQTAIEDYNQAIKINPNYANAYYNRGLARYNLGNNQAAIEDYNQAIKINPNYANAYYNRGLARYNLRNNQAAIEDYNQAIKINPNDANTYYNRGLARYNLGNNQAAIEDYNQAIKINPNYANAYYNRGNSQSNLGNKQAAIEDFRKSADLYKQQGKESDYQDALKRIKQLELG
ncbi:tetratricopeptide repeat protein [Nostoc sp.]|uniref:tetratricopeptide repeat protein n=1 Tax=Nostoc sp. TaxID=1180 RepID=UPI002FFD5644